MKTPTRDPRASKRERRQQMYRQLQREAARRPGSEWVMMPNGRRVVMSPIEAQLYYAMVELSLSPVPQWESLGYFLDFAFPDQRIGVEADGAAYHTGEANERRDRERDTRLERAGWTIVRFTGSQIHRDALGCAHVVRSYLEGIESGAPAPVGAPRTAPRPPARLPTTGGYWRAVWVGLMIMVAMLLIVRAIFG